MLNKFRNIILISSILGLKATLLVAGFSLISTRHTSQSSQMSVESAVQTSLNSSKLGQQGQPADFGQVPLSFEVNQGQAARQVKFLSRGQGYALFLTADEAVLALKQKTDAAQADAVLRITLDNANRTPEITAQDELPGKSNYFIGSDPQAWLRDVPTFARVQYKDVYPGIDQVFYGNGRQLEYDFIVAPEVAPDVIALDFAGADKMQVDATGDLVLTVGGEQIRQQRPVIYQEVEGERRAVAGNYVLKGKNKIGFTVGAYDHAKPLMIDPVLVYSTYLGGNGADSGRAIAIDNERNVYVTGSTSSTNFPTANPLQPNNSSTSFGDVFVTKINAAGTQIVYSTYFGGSIGDIGYGIDIDAAGSIYVTGVTGGTSGANDFPTTTGAFDRTFTAPDESFLLKLNSSGNALLYSTYTGATIGFEVKVDKATGEAFVAGNAGESLPTTPGAFRTDCPSCTSASFVTKFNATGSGLVYSTYIGSGPANDLAIDAGGNAYITGSTLSSVFPVTPGAPQQTCTGCNLGRSDAFVTKLNPTGSALVYSTYLGGSLSEVGRGIAVDGSGNAYVTGRTESSNSVSVPFPTTPGAYQTTSQGTPDSFVTKVNPTGTAFVYSTFLGGNVRDEAFGIATDSLGNAHIIGQTRSTNFPLVNPFQSICPQNGDCVFMASLNPAGAAVVFSTFFGQGEGVEIAADNTGNIYATGVTYQGLANLPTMNPIQPNHGAVNSVFDAFVTKIQVQEVPTRKTQFDFDGDGKADLSVFRPAGGNWYIRQSSDNALRAEQFGLATDRIAPADFDGDGKTDIAVFRDGTWYMLRSTQGFTSVQFGQAADVPVARDYDGDSKADVAVFRPATGNWYVLQSSDNQFRVFQFGQANDKPVPADYDGDAKADFAVFRPANGTWFINRSSDNSLSAMQFGTGSDIPVTGDFDGDDSSDLAVFRPENGTWYLQQTTAGFRAVQFGISGDLPVPADYDGDGQTDIAVVRQGNWYLQQSGSGFASVQFGVPDDVPVPYVH